MHEKVELSGITKQIMPGLEGDPEDWQTQEVNVTRGEAEGDIEIMPGPLGDLEKWQTLEMGDIEIMPGPSGDLEKWQTLEVNVTLG